MLANAPGFRSLYARREIHFEEIYSDILMKAVDFVVELVDRCLFIEIKDPQDPQVPSQRLNAFVQEFQSG